MRMKKMRLTGRKTIIKNNFRVVIPLPHNELIQRINRGSYRKV
jgi:hypothetical protein